MKNVIMKNVIMINNYNQLKVLKLAQTLLIRGYAYVTQIILAKSDKTLSI